jgi:hypothetical protein
VRIQQLTAWATVQPLAFMTLILRVWKFDAKSRQRLELVECEFTILEMRPFPLKGAEMFPNQGVSKEVIRFCVCECCMRGTRIFCSNLCANPPWSFCYRNTVLSSKGYSQSNRFFQTRNVPVTPIYASGSNFKNCTGIAQSFELGIYSVEKVITGLVIRNDAILFQRRHSFGTQFEFW